MKSVKNNLTVFLLILMLGLSMAALTCKKDEDPHDVQMETMARKLTGEISADSLQSNIEWLQGMGTRFALAENHRDVAMAILRRFKNMGYTDSRIDSFLLDVVYKNIRYQQWQYNVAASLQGTTYPDSVCIVGAHYDDNLRTGDPFLVDPGANDNAGGVAAALELARVIRKNNYLPKNTIEFVAFGAEELGLYGSKEYSARANESSKKIKLMLNNDMIAFEPGTDPSSWNVIIKDYDNSHELRKEAEKMCTKFTSLTHTYDNTYNQQSDSYPFFMQGYKAIFFFSNIMDPEYHSLNDISENCNFAYCREIVKVSCALLVYNN